MKRWIVLLAAIAACSPTASEEQPIGSVAQLLVAFVQANGIGPRTPQQNVSLAFTSNQTAGNLNVAFVGWNDTVSNATSVTDSLGNTYQLAVGPTRFPGLVSQSVYYASNVAAGANTVTAHFDRPAAFVDLRIAEYANVALTNPLDATASVTGSVSNASVNIATTAPNDILVAGDVTTLGTSAGSGWTERFHTQPNDNLVEDRQGPTAGTYAATMTISGNWVMQAVAFKTKVASDGGQEASSDSGGTGTGGSGGGSGSDAPRDISLDSGPDVVDAGVDAAPDAPDAGGTVCTNLFPLHNSIDNRTLVANDGTPFPILGRTAWFLISLNASDRTTFLNDTQARGYNAVELMMITRHPAGNHPPFDGAGNAPFVKRLDGANWDGSFGGPAPDFTTPNEAYWAGIDALFADLENRGMIVLAFPAYVGAPFSGQGWDGETQSNGPTKVQTYATRVATRYANRRNIVWMVGGDQGNPDASIQSALLTGLQGVGQPQRYYSAEWSTEMAGTDQPTFGAQMTLNSDYSFSGDVITVGRRAYSYPQTRPAYLLEEPYDQEGPDGTNFNPHAGQPVRRFEWWGWLSTIGGYMSGNGFVWPFTSGWQSHLSTQNAQDCTRLNAFIKSKHWYDLKPDGLGVRTIVTAQNGSAAIAAAATSDGNLAVIYIGPGYSGTFTIDASIMSHSFAAKWFDPTSGAYQTLGTFANSGTRTFSLPGSNTAGDNDWVLVLE